MALIKADRVKETSTSETTANFILGGAATGYRAFSSVCAIGDTFYYAISHQTLNQWECGLGTYGAGNVLERTTVHASSNSGAKVNFSAGTKECFLTLTARHLDRIQDNGQSTAIGSKTSVVAVNDSATLPDLDLQFADLKTLTAKYGPTPSYSRASTGTYFNASGVLTSAAVNEPRFDHVLENGAWVSKGLLIEEQRTNLLPYSSELNNTSLFSTSQASVLSNSDICPDGSQSADKLVENTSNSEHGGEYAYVSHSTNTRYTFSTFLKSAGRSIIRVLLANGAYSGNLIAYFDLSSGTVTFTSGSVTASILNVGNGWYRISVGGLTISTISILSAQVRLVNSGTTTVYTGDGSSGMLFWGAQFEVGSFASSYIPTTTTSAVRSADVCQITGSAFTNLWNATEGSVVVEQDLLSYSNPAADQRYFSIAGASNQPAFILNYNNGTDLFWYRYFSGLDQLVLPDINSAFKVALAFKTNDYATVLNGGTLVTSSTKTLPTDFGKMDIGYQVGDPARSSWVQRIRYFRSRLDNAQLVNLSGGINTLAFKTVTGSGSVTVANEFNGINISVPNPLPITNGGTNATTQLAAVTNLVGNPPNDGWQYTLASKKTSGTPTFYWVDGTGYAPTLDLLFAADKSLTAYKGPTPTFSRASSGSFFDSTGVLRIQGYNILQYSEDFDNAYWTKSLTTILSNVAIAPNGQMTADKIVETQASGFHSVNRTTGVSSSASSTASIYLKAGERTFASLEIVDNSRAVINLTDGTVVSNTLASSTVTTENVGNGWWRVKYTTNSSAIGRLVIYPLPSSTFGSYSGDGSSGIFAWGAQVESGSNANLYSATTNAANSAPRFNHTFNGTSWVSRGLLVEEQRTNLVPRSEEFNTAWFKNAISVSSNSLTSPDGQLTADKLIPSAANTFHGLYTYPLNLPSTGLYTVSTYVKSGEYSKPLILFLYDASRWAGVQFDLSTGSVLYSASLSYTLSNPSIVSVGGGWYRISVTCNLNATTSYIGFSVSNNSWTSGSINDFAFAGDGASGAYFWGAQVESGSFPTSYIPTTSASATRSADVCQITGSDFSGFWNGAEGAVVVEYDRLAPIGTAATPGYVYPRTFSFTGTSGNDIALFGRHDSSPPQELVSASASSVQQFAFSPNTTDNTALGVQKIALAFKTDDSALSYKGAAVLTDNSCTVPVITSLSIGSLSGSSNYLSGHIYRLRYYPVRLPNATLQVLST